MKQLTATDSAAFRVKQLTATDFAAFHVKPRDGKFTRAHVNLGCLRLLSKSNQLNQLNSILIFPLVLIKIRPNKTRGRKERDQLSKRKELVPTRTHRVSHQTSKFDEETGSNVSSFSAASRVI